jgi:hypothetical protein
MGQVWTIQAGMLAWWQPPTYPRAAALQVVVLGRCHRHHEQLPGHWRVRLRGTSVTRCVTTWTLTGPTTLQEAADGIA